MANKRPLRFDHLYRIKMSSELVDRLEDAAAKTRRTLPDFIRLVLEDAVAEPRILPPDFTHSKANLPGWTKK